MPPICRFALNPAFVSAAAAQQPAHMPPLLPLTPFESPLVADPTLLDVSIANATIERTNGLKLPAPSPTKYPRIQTVMNPSIHQQQQPPQRPNFTQSPQLPHRPQNNPPPMPNRLYSGSQGHQMPHPQPYVHNPVPVYSPSPQQQAQHRHSQQHYVPQGAQSPKIQQPQMQIPPRTEGQKMAALIYGPQNSQIPEFVAIYDLLRTHGCSDNDVMTAVRTVCEARKIDSKNTLFLDSLRIVTRICEMGFRIPAVLAALSKTKYEEVKAIEALCNEQME